jgi:hypothetical protein
MVAPMVASRRSARHRIPTRRHGSSVDLHHMVCCIWVDPSCGSLSPWCADHTGCKICLLNTNFTFFPHLNIIFSC